MADQDYSAGPIIGSRDLRIDFIRGVVMAMLVITHTEIFSLYNLLTWERVGLVTGAEGFVILAGVVVGMVSGHRLRTKGPGPAAQTLFDRALQLYRVNVAVIAITWCLRAFTIADVREITTFTDRGANITYPLFTAVDAPIQFHLVDILLLRSGPQQVQVLGLYVAVLILSPLALLLLNARRTGTLLMVSFLAYITYWAFGIKLTSAQFENAFPILAWQFIYFVGLAIGFHRAAVFEFLDTPRGKLVIALATVIAVACFALAQSTPNQFLPSWSRFEFIPADVFERVRLNWFDKNNLRPGRVVNDFALLLVALTLLSRFWRPVARATGWFFIPFGQATLYLFAVHVFIVMLVSNLVPFGFYAPPRDMLLNTVVHTTELAVLWLMVRYQVLWGWIPR